MNTFRPAPLSQEQNQSIMPQPMNAERSTSFLAQESLTVDELKARLYESLRSKGVVDKLKSQLRAKLVSELKTKAQVALNKLDATHRTDLDKKLLFKVIDSMVIEYFKAREYDFSLSVFLPESGITHEHQILDDSDIFQFLHLDHPSSSLQHLRQTLESDSSVLLIKLLRSISAIGNVTTTSKESQTTMTPSEILEFKLQTIEHQFNNTDTVAATEAFMEERIQKIQQDYETRLKDEVDEQLKRLKDVEISQMRLEERKKFQSDLLKAELEYERKDSERRRRIEEWEEKEKERLGRKEKDLEKSVYEQRQKLLDDMENLRLREENIRKHSEILTKQLEIKDQEWETKYKSALGTIDQLQHFKSSFDTRLQQEILNYKMDFERAHKHELADMERDKIKLKTDMAVLNERQTQVEARAAQIDTLEYELREIRDMLNKSQSECEKLKTEVEKKDELVKELGIQARTARGEANVEFENQTLRRQLMDAEKLAERRQEEYQELLRSFMGPTKQHVAEIDRLRRSEAKWQSECQQLVVKLEMELNRADEYQTRFEDEVLRNKELKREISDLRLLLHQTQTALNNELTHQKRISDSYRPASSTASSGRPIDLSSNPYFLPEEKASEFKRASPVPLPPMTNPLKRPEVVIIEDTQPVEEPQPRTSRQPSTSTTQLKPTAPSSRASPVPVSKPASGVSEELVPVRSRSQSPSSINKSRPVYEEDDEARELARQRLEHELALEREKRRQRLEEQAELERKLNEEKKREAEEMERRRKAQQQEEERERERELERERLRLEQIRAERERERDREAQRLAEEQLRAEQERKAREEAERAKEVEEAQGKEQKLAEIENDPLMKKYIELVKQKREREAAVTSSSQIGSAASLNELGSGSGALADKSVNSNIGSRTGSVKESSSFDIPSLPSNRSGSFDFGGGDTGDSVSAPVFDDDTNTDNGW